MLDESRRRLVRVRVRVRVRIRVTKKMIERGDGSGSLTVREEGRVTLCGRA